jgi:hypothetical protein
MSTPTPQTPPASNPPPPPPAPPQRRNVLIISHSNLFYWWPVWALGFIMFLISMFGEIMATVPAGTEAKPRIVQIPPNKDEKAKEPDIRHALVFPKGADEPTTPRLHVSGNKNLGVLFIAVLLLVIFITNIPLRGLWSFIVILFIVFIVVVLSILEVWSYIFGFFETLDVRITAGGYFIISSFLFALWLVVFLFFDRQIYMIVEPGQVRVCQAIGDAETSYDTTGMSTTKQRSDLFRHWILGLGSGDLIVKTSGANPVEIHMNNVLFIGRKHAEIEEMLRAKETIATDGIPGN